MKRMHVASCCYVLLQLLERHVLRAARVQQRHLRRGGSTT